MVPRNRAERPYVEVQASVDNLQEINLERNTSCCDEPLSSHRRSPESTNQPGLQTQLS